MDSCYCSMCSCLIDVASQYYIIGDIGPELTCAIENRLGHKVDIDGSICAQCFRNIIQSITASTPRGASLSPQSIDCKPQIPRSTNVCVWCQNSLYKKRALSLLEGPERNLISHIIAPRQMPVAGMVCNACWIQAQRLLKEQGIITTPVSNSIKCVWCQRSIAQARRHAIPEGPEHDEIKQNIFPRQIPLGGLVCYACWMKARRNVQRAQNIHARQIDPLSIQNHFQGDCAWCHTSLFRRRMHTLIAGPERNEVAARIYPAQLPEPAYVCNNCWTTAHENVLIQSGMPVPLRNHNPSINLNEYAHTPSTSSYCFVPGCTNPERNSVPNDLRKFILKHKKIFVTESARICTEHKNTHNLEFLEQEQFAKSFTSAEIEAMLKLSLTII